MFKEDRLALYRLIGKTGDAVRGRFLRKPIMFANSPELAHDVLVEKAKSFEKSPGVRLLLYYAAGRGLFTSEGELWRRQRRLMAPLFTASSIGRYAQAMNDAARFVMSELRDGQSIDIAHETTRIAMGVVGKTLFSTDMFSESDELGAALTVALGWAGNSAASNRLFFHIIGLDLVEALPTRLGSIRTRLHELLEEPFMLENARSRVHQDAIKRLDRMVQEMIDERRRNPGGDDLLTRLLHARDAEDASFKGMSDRQVRDEAITLFIAGHETTATSLAWSFYLLAKNPEWRARVQAEVDALPPGPIDVKSASKLDLTARVFKEAMRLYPPVDMIARRSLEPVTVGDVALDKGSIVFASPWIIHRHAPTWRDPEKFDPDRFLKPPPRGAWLPFSAGPRVCIGNHFAMLEGPIVLATMMRDAHFEIDASRTIEPEMFATLRPRGGVPATVRFRRTHAAA
jgi:cytochrome P450